ncbi:MAG: M28 family peptidase [Paludibacteraceae bacterium]|nr:M28 family peptidase [Paludibacteraceae bacterium]
MKKLMTLPLLLALLTACHTTADSSEGRQQEQVTVVAKAGHPVFSADSCFARLTDQTSLGSRCPNSPAHAACKAYLTAQLKLYGAVVSEQSCQLKAWDGTLLDCTNITASYLPAAKNRVLLCAHWDSRPWSDEDPDPERVRAPLLGANDGASGVAVLLEIARNLGLQSPKVGVDIVLFDAEDYGISEEENSFCLGSQYWAQQAKLTGYKAAYGILLDMVGDKNAVFRKDAVSAYFAPAVAQKVWERAAEMGYGALFAEGGGGSIIDDHYYINRLAGIPCIDIIHYDGGFPATWHTTHDTPDAISRDVLGAVGSVVLDLLY